VDSCVLLPYVPAWCCVCTSLDHARTTQAFADDMGNPADIIEVSIARKQNKLLQLYVDVQEEFIELEQKKNKYLKKANSKAEKRARDRGYTKFLGCLKAQLVEVTGQLPMTKASYKKKKKFDKIKNKYDESMAEIEEERKHAEDSKPAICAFIVFNSWFDCQRCLKAYTGMFKGKRREAATSLPLWAAAIQDLSSASRLSELL